MRPLKCSLSLSLSLPLSDCVPITPSDPPPPSVTVSEEVRESERRAVTLSEQGDLSTGLEQLNEVIRVAPEYASAYNNRAQVLRLHLDLAL